MSSLVPSQELTWPLGPGYEILAQSGPEPITVTINANGPFGALPEQQYVISPMEWRDAQDAPPGNLHYVRKAIQELTESTKGR